MRRPARLGLHAGISTGLAFLAGATANVYTADWNVTVGVALGVLVITWIAWEVRRAVLTARAGSSNALTDAPEPRHRTLVGVIPALADCYQDRGLGWRPDASLVVLSGTGGAGKTQAAAAHAHANWTDAAVDLLVWITASDRTAIIAGYARSAEAAGIGGGHEGDDDALRFLTWLAQTDQTWLIVLDDLTTPGDLAGLWPPRTSTGRVVVTTRRRDASLRRSGELVDVGPFTAAEAAAYLREKLADVPERLTGAGELADDLGKLPLAMAQAAAYIVDRDIDCVTYCGRYADRSRTLADLGPEPEALPDDQNLPLAAAWSLSFQLADEITPAGQAGRLLAVLALLDPNGIPMDLLKSAAVSRFVGEADVRDVVMHLRRLGLLDTSADGRLVRIHALVQRAARESIDASSAAVSAADGLMEVWPDTYSTDTAQQMSLYANTVALRAAADADLWQGGAHPVILRAVDALSQAGLRDAAGLLLRTTLSVAQEHLGADHPGTLAVRHQLAGWLGQSDPAQAVVEHEPVLTDRTRVLGPDHADTLMTRNNMLFWQGKTGDAQGSAAGFASLADDTARALGPVHENTLAVRNNLAYWLGEAGRTEEALQTATALVDDSVRAFGAQAPETIRHRHVLAVAKGNAGFPAEAAVDLDALVPELRRVFGADHLTTLIVRQHRAQWRGEAGEPSAAVRQCRELLADRLRVLGPLHPDTLSSRRELARWVAAAGNRFEAARILEELLTDQRRGLSSSHPDLAATRDELTRLRERGAAQR
jgi:hypothetical protein